MGDHNLNTATDSIYTLDKNIINIKRHENYNPSNQENDIAVLTTDSNIIYTRGVGPACIPFSYPETFTDAAELYGAGWGSREFGGPLSPVLLQVKLNVIPNRQCSVRYPNVVNTQICTYTPGKDACQVNFHSL